jgi:hypothetical protein
VEFDESNGSQGAIKNCDDVGNEPLRKSMKNMPVEDIKPKDDENNVQVINQPSSSNVSQDNVQVINQPSSSNMSQDKASILERPLHPL